MLRAPHAPMQENRPPTQQKFCATPIIAGTSLIFKDGFWKWAFVSYLDAV